jgi:hypothetical protein
MKERLNLTIDGELLDAMKAYAAGKQMSVSELVENYFRSVTRPVQRRNILDLVDGLEAPDVGGVMGLSDREKGFEGTSGLKEPVGVNVAFRDHFYKEQEKKYGF